jgi:hypothetical protein
MSPEAFADIYPNNLVPDARQVYAEEKLRRERESGKPTDAADRSQQQDLLPTKYEGIRRFPYWAGIIGANIFYLFVPAAGSPQFALIALAIGAVFLVWLTARRFQNMGLSAWWSILALIPIVNLITVLFCGIIPEGDFAKKEKRT